MHRISLTGVLITCCLAQSAAAENWPAWRGPLGNGVCRETQLPTRFGPTENVTWKAPLPQAGNSTPIVWDDRVFVTCPIDGGKIRSLLCFDRRSGKELWRHEVPYPHAETIHRDNTFCAGSPTTDGKLVYASFDSAGVVACDFSGKVVWSRDLGRLAHVFGPAATPVLYKHLLIIHRGPGEPTHIIALAPSDGQLFIRTYENLYCVGQRQE